MPKKKPTWQEKLNDSKGYPKVEELKDGMAKIWGTGTLVIPALIEVDELMRKVPEAKLLPSTKSAKPSPPNTTPQSAAQ
jgi:hypothetical protein